MTSNFKSALSLWEPRKQRTRTVQVRSVTDAGLGFRHSVCMRQRRFLNHQPANRLTLRKQNCKKDNLIVWLERASNIATIELYDKSRNELPQERRRKNKQEMIDRRLGTIALTESDSWQQLPQRNSRVLNAILERVCLSAVDMQRVVDKLVELSSKQQHIIKVLYEDISLASLLHTRN